MNYTHKNAYQVKWNTVLLFVIGASLFAGLDLFTSFDVFYEDNSHSFLVDNSLNDLEHQKNGLSEINPSLNYPNNLDLHQVSIDIGISGELSLDTQIWLGCRKQPPNSHQSSKWSIDSNVQEVLLINNSFQQRKGIVKSNYWKTWDIYGLGFSKDQVVPTEGNIWYLRIENSINGSQRYQERISANPYRKSNSQSGGWLKEFRIRFGSDYVFRSLLHPYITYGTNCTVELTFKNTQLVQLQPSPSKHNQRVKYIENDMNLLGAALIVGLSHYEYESDLDFADDEASILLEALLETGKYDIYYLIEGNAKYTVGTYPDIYITDNEIEEGLEMLANETSAGDNAIVMFSGYGGAPDLYGDAAIYSMASNSPSGKWESVITQHELLTALQEINDVNDSVNIFTWLNLPEGQHFKYIVEDGNISNAILWWYDGFMLHGSEIIEGVRAFGTNLNYAFYSLEELYDTKCTYPSSPRWHSGNNNGYFPWRGSTVGSVSSYRLGDYQLIESDGYDAELFLNPHTAQIEVGCWEISPSEKLTSSSGDYRSELANYPIRRWIKVWEHNNTENCNIGVKYVFTKHWDTDLDVQFNVRATSTANSTEKITNFYARIYDENGTYVSNSERLIYLTSNQDTSWEYRCLYWSGDILSVGNNYQLIFYYQDISNPNYVQTIYINSTLTISESDVSNIYYMTGFEDEADLAEWIGIDPPESTTFTRSSLLKKEGNYAGCQNAEGGINNRRDLWDAVEPHNGGILEGWIFNSFLSGHTAGGQVDVDLLFINKWNRYGFSYHVDYIRLYAIVEGRIDEWFYYLRETHENTWWWFRIELRNHAGSRGEDVLQLWWKRAGNPLETTQPKNILVGNLEAGYISLFSLIGGSYGATYFDDLVFRFNYYKTGFEETGEMNEWTGIETPENTQFSRSSTLKKEGRFAGWQKGNTSSVYRTDRWDASGLNYGGILEGWVYHTHSDTDGKVEINVHWQNIDNRVGIMFHSDYIAVFILNNGNYETWKQDLGQDYSNTWWWFRIKLRYAEPTKEDNIELSWFKEGGSINTFQIQDISLGNLGRGYIALRSTVSSSSETYFDELKFRPYFDIPEFTFTYDNFDLSIRDLLVILGLVALITIIITFIYDKIFRIKKEDR
ncbi:MAG: hypothetical protein ACFFCQ_05140 [Promethearchaeota archaeon]